jgi:Spy/CpxP family protein refolding chaperone
MPNPSLKRTVRLRRFACAAGSPVTSVRRPQESLMVRPFYLSLAIAIAVALPAFAVSPYADQASRSIKSLSDEEIADYLSGKGMGLAKAAELNGYPGPAHVLELADQLALSPTQKVRTDKIFERMQAQAKSVGKRVIDEENKLDQLFASKNISSPLLHQTLGSIASLQAEVREIHLQAHLDEAQVLTEAQTMKYWHLRGYGGGAGHTHGH